MLLAVHKLSLVICLLLGVLYLFSKKTKIRAVHRWSGFIALLSILIYLFQMNSGQFDYFIYMLFIALAAIIPYICKQKKSTIIHLTAAVSSIVWLVLIHI